MIGDIEVDHIVPASFGGKSEENNLQPLCRVCNALKRDRMTNGEVVQWIKNNLYKYNEKRCKRSQNPTMVINQIVYPMIMSEQINAK
jgi:5-methylcytosine-specific restriction endonuclease McrA